MVGGQAIGYFFDLYSGGAIVSLYAEPNAATATRFYKTGSKYAQFREYFAPSIPFGDSSCRGSLPPGTVCIQGSVYSFSDVNVTGGPVSVRPRYFDCFVFSRHCLSAGCFCRKRPCCHGWPSHRFRGSFCWRQCFASRWSSISIWAWPLNRRSLPSPFLFLDQ